MNQLKILIELANFYNVRRFVFASSCSVYGATEEDVVTEESALNPVSLYAKTRIMSEEEILERCGNVEPVILGLSTVFGLSTRMRFDLVVNLLSAKGLLMEPFRCSVESSGDLLFTVMMLRRRST